MKNFWRDKVVVLTGAASGIGREIAREVRRRGALLALIDIRTEDLHKFASELGQNGSNPRVYAADLSKRDQVERACQGIERDFDRVDILINNAGFTVFSTFANHSLDDFEKMLAVNFMGTVFMCKFLLPSLRRSKRAQIVNMSSILGIVAPPVQTSYSAAKAATRAFSVALGEELKEFGILVSTIIAGQVKTQLNASAVCDPIYEAERMRYCEHVNRVALDANYAAVAILRGIEKGRTRIFLGLLDRILDLAERALPGLGTRLAVLEISRGVGGQSAFRELIRKSQLSSQ